MRPSLLVYSLLCVPAVLSADDRVVLQLDDNSSRIALTCQILDYTGSLLRVRTRDGSARTYTAAQVVEVQTTYTEPHNRGLTLLAETRVPEAQTEFEAALKAESRTWVRREILSQLVRCALYAGDYGTATRRFLLITESDPATVHFPLVPVLWAPHALDSALQTEARQWLTDKSPAARLIGASYLLNDAYSSESAEQELRRLAVGPHADIARLAESQLWRVRLRMGEISELELQRWEQAIDSLPEKLRGGPYYLLGQGWLSRQEWQRAAAHLLWVPLVYDHDHHLASRALYEAATALQHIGQKKDAARLLKEITTRFASTSFAQDALATLQSMQSESSRNSRG